MSKKLFGDNVIYDGRSVRLTPEALERGLEKCREMIALDQKEKDMSDGGTLVICEAKLKVCRTLLKEILDGKYRYHTQYEGDEEIPTYFDVIEAVLHATGKKDDSERN